MIQDRTIWSVKLAILLVASLVLFSLSQLEAKADDGKIGPALEIRNNIQVTGHNVTLGDVFKNIGDAADVFVMQAPEPGRFQTLPILDVVSLVRQYNLNWQRPEGMTRIRVERKSRILDPQEIKLIVQDAIQREANIGNFSVTLYGNSQNIYMPAEVTSADVSVNTVSLDRRTGRFTTSINLPLGDNQYRALSLTGRMEEYISVPVLIQGLSKDDVIGDEHISWQDLPKQRVSQNVLLDDGLIVGMAARRNLRPDTPLRASDVQIPVLIRKGTLVSMSIVSGSLKLSTIGRALEDGGENDIIKIVNIDSHKTIEGRVKGPDDVEILYQGSYASTGQ